MRDIDLKQMVKEAVGMEWEQFAKRHPALAREINRELVIERTMDELRGNEGFTAAMQKMESGAAEGSVIEEIISQAVRIILLAV